jgi:4-amino-4-deoxy-L-arabinose transferase-like glycosyltransferase
MDFFWQFAGMIAFGLSCWAVGDFLRQALLAESSSLSPVARHTLSFAAGNVALSYLLTALGFAGLFLPPVFWILLLGGLGLGVWRIVGLSIERRSSERGEGKKIPKGIKEEKFALIFLAICVGVFLLFGVLQAAAPPCIRDSLVYHLLCPKEYLQAGHLLHIEGNLFSAFPKGQEVLMTLLLAIAGDRAAQGYSLLQHIAMAGAVYGLVRFVASPWTAALCAIGCATVPPAIYFSGCGYVEPALLMTVATSLLVLTYLLHSRSESSAGEAIGLRGSAWVGFLAGWMAALKYTGLIYLALIGFLLLWNQRKAPAVKALMSGGTYALAALPGLCWMVWNWVALGNPVYPMAWSIFGGSGWDDSRARAMTLYYDLYGMGKDPLDYLLLPWRLAFSGQFYSVQFDGAIGPFLLLFLIAAIVSAIPSIRRQLTERIPQGIGVAVLASAAFFVWGTQHSRFWLPTQVLICIASAPAIELLLRWANRRRAIRAGLALTVGLSLAWNMWFLGKPFLAEAYYRPVFGLEEERAFLSRRVPGYPAIEFINSHLPESSRTLCVWTGALGYYFNRPYYSDTFFEDITLKSFIDSSSDGEELSRRLAEAGFSHFYIYRSLLGKNMEPRQKEIFRDFLAKKAENLFLFKEYAVLEIVRN